MSHVSKLVFNIQSSKLMHCHVNSNNFLFSFITLLSYMYIHTTKTSFKYGATVSFRLYKQIMVDMAYLGTLRLF